MERNYRMKKIAELNDAIEATKTAVLLTPETKVSKGMRYHLDSKIKLSSNIFRVHSSEFLSLFREARDLWKRGSLAVCEEDEWFLNSDIGKTAMLNGIEVPLDLPIEIDDDESYVSKFASQKKKKKEHGRLNSPRRIGKGDPGHGKKKFIVHVKNPATGNIKTITFGDANLSVKANNPARRKSFLARHNCDNPGPKTSARYWSCNLHRYKKQLGLKFEGRW